MSASLDPSGTRWLIKLSDTGTGIPPELLGKVFKPMFTTKPEGQGTGLGLAICREIVRAHGGEIHIESEEGRGTTMSFPLPALPKAAGVAGSGGSDPSAPLPLEPGSN